ARAYGDASLLVRSDLARVVETAATLERALGLTGRVDPRLREIDMGSWSGKSWRRIAEEDPHGFRRWCDGEDIARGGGETYAELQARVWSAIRDLASGGAANDGDEPHATVVVVTHGGPIRVAVAAALGLPGTGWQALDPVDNCS